MRNLLETFHQLAPTHAILDAARSDRILPLLSQQQFDYVSLYDGYSAQSLADYAPYLVRLPQRESISANCSNPDGETVGAFIYPARSPPILYAAISAIS
jgi:hypothetical protein